jgi:hypothetical protein
MPDTHVTIVVPTIRRANIADFLAAWRDEFAGHRVIVMEDNPEPTFDLNDDSIVHLSWRDVEAELGEWSWIVPRRTDCVRSFGYLRAVQLGTDVIVTLDDDCFPIRPGFIEAHVNALRGDAEEVAWTSTGTGIVPRGASASVTGFGRTSRTTTPARSWSSAGPAGSSSRAIWSCRPGSFTRCVG